MQCQTGAALYCPETYTQFIEYSLLSKTALEWDDAKLLHYHVQRLMINSMLCRFKTIYPAERIDSVHHLLENKELQIRRTVQALD